MDKAIISFNSFFIGDRRTRLFGEIVFQLEQCLAHFRCRFGTEPGFTVLRYHVLNFPLRGPKQPLPHPLIKMIVRAAGMSDVSNSITQSLIEKPMVIAWPRKKREPIVNHRKSPIRLA